MSYVLHARTEGCGAVSVAGRQHGDSVRSAGAQPIHLQIQTLELMHDPRRRHRSVPEWHHVPNGVNSGCIYLKSAVSLSMKRTCYPSPGPACMRTAVFLVRRAFTLQGRNCLSSNAVRHCHVRNVSRARLLSPVIPAVDWPVVAPSMLCGLCSTSFGFRLKLSAWAYGRCHDI